LEKHDLEYLMNDLTCEDIIKCQKARRRLVAIGHGAVPELVKALASRKNSVRWEAAKALAQIGDPTATDTLVKTLEDREFDLRWLAAEGLIAIGKPAVAPLLQALIDNPKSRWLIEGAHHVLHDMDRHDWDEVLKPVMEALESFEPSVEVPAASRIALDALVGKKRR